LAGCGGPTRSIDIDGSSTVFPISEGVATGFRDVDNGVEVTVGQSGTGGGFKRFGQGETDISDASRPIRPDEFEACKKNGVEFIELPVAFDGLTFVVHPSNDWCKELTIDHLRKMFLADQAAKKWKDVDDAWPDEEIKIYAPGTDSGTFDYFKEVVAGKEKKNIRGDMSTSEDDHVLVTGVAGTPNSIGFFGIAYYLENKEKLKAVPVVNPATKKAVEPSPETIRDNSYAPFSRPLFIYVNRASLEKPHVDKFVTYYLESCDKVSAEVGYVPLAKTVTDRARQVLKDRTLGTCYIDAKGAARQGPIEEVYQKDQFVSTK
jgi:phosphate transport system substrate-binding protein